MLHFFESVLTQGDSEEVILLLGNSISAPFKSYDMQMENSLI